MKKKLLACILSMILTVLLCSNVFAAQTQSVKYDNESFSFAYMDAYNVSHYVNVCASVEATVGWDEGVSGYVYSAYFPLPSVTIDNNKVGVSYIRNTTLTGSSAYQVFSINNTSMCIQPTLNCDEYGDIAFWVRYGECL